MSSFNVMLAKAYKPAMVKDWSCITVEPKWDGIRVICLVDVVGMVQFYSRNGRELKMLSHLDGEAVKLAKRLHKMNRGYEGAAMLDGEIVSASGDFDDISGAIHRKDATVEEARYRVFHAMPLKVFQVGEDRMPQQYRAKCLGEALSYLKYELIGHVPPVKVDDDKDVQRLYKKYRQRGFEGAMVKNMNEPWVGKRSSAWLKMKAEETADIKVIGFKEGSGKYKGTLGALICRYKKRKVRVSGMTDAQRDMFWKSQQSMRKRVIEVSYQNITNNGSLRHPRFKRLRPDKEKL